MARTPVFAGASNRTCTQSDDYIISDYNKRQEGSDQLLRRILCFATKRLFTPVRQSFAFRQRLANIKIRTNQLPANRLRVTYRWTDSSSHGTTTRELVYYWFVVRGRTVANEYWSKWYLFVDAITRNRTDGALVRLVTPFYSGESEQAADERLQSFIKELELHLSAYLPSETALNAKSVMHQSAGRQC